MQEPWLNNLMQLCVAQATMVSMHEFGDVDQYGLSARILGIHREEFFGAIGRIVCVSAVLEEKVTTLRHTLANAEQGKFTHEPVSAQISAARRLARELPEDRGPKIEEFLDAVEAAFWRRNDLVHSSFPAQPDGRIWGHRATRNKAVTDGTADIVETTIADLLAQVGQLARLVLRFNHVHALVGMHRHPGPR